MNMIGSFLCEHHLIMDVTNTYGFAREPVLSRMPDGSMLCTYLSGGHTEPENENVVLAVRSYDDGITWTQPHILFSHRERAAYCTEIFNAHDLNHPILFLNTYAAETRYREMSTFYCTTTDSGHTWSDPVSLPGPLSHVNIRQGIILSNGTWLFPVYWEEVRARWDWKQIPTPNTIHDLWPCCCGVLISDDKGKSFTEYGYHSAPFTLMENVCIEAEKGHVIMLIRAQSHPFLYRTDSYDYGVTWTQVGPCDIPSASSKLSLVKYKEHILLIHNAITDTNNGVFTERKNLSIWISNDNFTTFDKKINLTAENTIMFYPHAFIDEKTCMLYIACENVTESYCLRIPFADLW